MQAVFKLSASTTYGRKERIVADVQISAGIKLLAQLYIHIHVEHNFLLEYKNLMIHCLCIGTCILL